MTIKQAIKKIQKDFDINAIFAQHILVHTNGQIIPEQIQKIIDEKAKPFVKWVGGKRQLLKQFRLMNLYPPEEKRGQEPLMIY